MLLKLYIVLIIHLVFSIYVLAQSASDTTKYIRHIIISRENVFPDSIQAESFLYEGANSLHTITKESVIRNELLFEEGDIYDAELVEQTERKLRGIGYLGDSKILSNQIQKDSVDIYVHTTDQWSLVPSYLISSGGGLTEVSGSLTEFNLLGFGKQLSTEATWVSDEGLTWDFSYSDPQFFGTKWSSYASYTTGPFITGGYLSFDHPYFSPDSKWAGGIGGTYYNQTQRIFNEGVEVSRVRLVTKSAVAYVSNSMGKRFKKLRTRILFSYEDRDFSGLGDQTTTPVPQDELTYSTFVSFTLQGHSFAKDTTINRFIRTEDFTLGRTTTLTVGRAGFPIPKGKKRWDLVVQHRQRFRLSRGHYLFLTAGYETEFYRNTIFHFFTRYFQKIFWHQTLAFNFELKVARELEESSQFLLGGDSGLRGYTARAFNGDKKFIMNLESRIFTGLKLFTVAMGGILFIDGGYAWPRNQSIDFSDLNYSAGFGFRFVFTKFPGSPIARIDFGYPINTGGGFGIALGVGQHF
jgi:outer membrane protein assembly factor BamA